MINDTQPFSLVHVAFTSISNLFPVNCRALRYSAATFKNASRYDQQRWSSLACASLFVVFSARFGSSGRPSQPLRLVADSLLLMHQAEINKLERGAVKEG